MKIVLVTSSQPSLNPRMVKEADVLSEKGYDVVVIGQYWNSWAAKTDKLLLASKKWKYVQVAGSPESQRFAYFISRLIHKAARKLREKLTLKHGVAELSIGRCSIHLYKEAIKQKADLYIGHNPGGLAPAIKAAKKLGVKCGFDIEDFHRREYSDNPQHPDVLCKTLLEEKYLHKADYLTAASPLIALEYQKLFPALNITPILNVFPKSNIQVKESISGTPLKLFWFSQTIGPNRGLDEIIEAMRIIASPLIELHLLGNPREHAVNYYNELSRKYGFNKNQINYYKPIPSDEIIHFAAQFDIGMATEIGVPYNRSICLTNKIFTYIQSGLALAASKTAAQEELLKRYPSCGRLFAIKDATGLADILRHYLNDRQALNDAKIASFLYGQENLNWEVESQKFITTVKETLAN